MAGLKAHRKRHLEKWVERAGMYDDEGLIFSSQIATPLNPENLVKRSFKPLLKRSGLPEIRFHDLRHTCATLLMGRGVHPKLVRELLGHATIAMTLDTYGYGGGVHFPEVGVTLSIFCGLTWMVTTRANTALLLPCPLAL